MKWLDRLRTKRYLRRVIEANRPRLEESIRRGEQELAEGKTTSLDELS